MKLPNAVRRAFSKTKRDLISLAPLFTLAKYLALLPPYNFATKKVKETTAWKTYKIAFFTCVAALSFASLLGRIQYLYPVLPATVEALDLLASLSIFLVNSASILGTNFWKLGAFENFLSKVHDVDAIFLSRNVAIRARRCRVRTELLICHAFIIFLITYDNYVWIRVSSGSDQLYTLFENFQRYHMNMAVFLICKFVSLIETRFRTYNSLLSAGRNANGKIEIAPGFVKAHSTICDLVDLFNEIFGWVILFVILDVVASFLIIVGYVIAYSSKTNVLDGDYRIDFIAASVLQTAVSVVLGVMITKSCNQAYKERQRTVTIAHKLMYEVCNLPPTHDRFARELAALVQETTGRNSTFSAAGFFTIDYTLLLTVLTSITSYLVVIIQFQK